MPADMPRVRGAMLLPLTGGQAPLGQAMLNAGTMALFDEAGQGIEFAPQDTNGTPTGAATAARRAIAGGARILVGPLTSAETAAVAPVARNAGVPLLAFTNDASRAGEGVWVLGVTPAQQVRRLVAASAAGGAQRFALGAPDNEFGRALAAALREATQDLGLPRPVIGLYPAGADVTMAAAALRSQAAQAEALLIGETGERARRYVAAYQAAEGEGGPPPRLLGTALWGTDGSLRGDPALAGAWFPGPDPGARSRFEARYRDAYGETPPRVAAVAYDAVALGTRSLRSGAMPGSTADTLAGAEGPVRLAQGGRTLRGLAVFSLSASGDPVLVAPAPLPGAPGS
jgi:ABC-type branched-subunit amino acid transport system substrate-binding protein